MKIKSYGAKNQYNENFGNYSEKRLKKHEHSYLTCLISFLTLWK